MDPPKKVNGEYTIHPEPNRKPDSPFLESEFFTAEKQFIEAEGESSTLFFRQESPFFNAFESEFQEVVAEPEDDSELEDEEMYEDIDEYVEEEMESENFDESLDELDDEFIVDPDDEVADYEREWEVEDMECDECLEDETSEEYRVHEAEIAEPDDFFDEPEDEAFDEEFEEEGLVEFFDHEEEAQETKEPLNIPSVSFAPPPPEGSYWPVITSHKYGHVVTYLASDGSPVGSEGKRWFHASRGAKRYHNGVDLFANLGDSVVACQDGKIVNFRRFCCKPRYTTWALYVEHANVVINYGEVAPDSLERLGLIIGSPVKAGQIIGYIGRNPGGSSMLHFETYTRGTRRNKRWLKGKKPPPELLNPTKYLLFLQKYGSVSAGTGQQPAPTAPHTGHGIDLARAVRLNRYYGKKLGWHNRQESIERFLGFTNYSPTEEIFAEAVADWQKNQGLEVDGVIGPNTWKRLQAALKTQTGQGIDLARAVRLNRYYGKKLGWHNRQESIERFLGFTNYSPTEEIFAEAVADWQEKQGFVVDGVIGPKTWKRMKTALAASAGSAPPQPSPTVPGPSPRAPVSTGAVSCGKEQRLNKLIKKKKGESIKKSYKKIWGLPGSSALFFKAGMAIDADGAPNAYHPKNIGIDYNGNAGYPPKEGKKPWGIVVDSKEKPYIQGVQDPFPGYFVSPTSLADKTKAVRDPERYVDSANIPYIALPPALKGATLRVRLGDFAAVINGKNGKVVYAVFADGGPTYKLGEGSIALSQALGHDPYRIRKGRKRAVSGISLDIIYVVFPRSGKGQGIIPSLDEINREGERLFNEWGGLEQVYRCFPQYAP